MEVFDDRIINMIGGLDRKGDYKTSLLSSHEINCEE